MVDKKFCDICETEIKGNRTGNYYRTGEDGESIDSTSIEVCPACAKDIERNVVAMRKDQK